MMEVPKKRDESIINRYMLNEIVVSSIYLLGVSILFLKMCIRDSVWNVLWVLKFSRYRFI